MFSFKQLQTYFPTYIGENNDIYSIISGVMTDSRCEKLNSLFVPIIGDTFNGHDFIEQALENGAIATLWQENERIPEELINKCMFFLVSDTVEALQQLATYYRKRVDPIVVAITGSNGKTTTKDIAKSVFSTTYTTYATRGNLNNHIGLPLTILEMDENTELLIVEMGMNQFDEIRRLSNIALPNYAIITNIGESHIEHLGSRDGIARAKLEIIAGLSMDGLLFIDGDERKLDHIKERSYVRTCGFNVENDVVVAKVENEGRTTTFSIDNVVYTLPLLGRHHAKNASFVIALAKELNVSSDTIAAQLRQIEQTDMRFEWIEGKNDVTIINDAYNASPTSMNAAIDILKDMTGFQTKGLILGDILELGSFSEPFHESVAKNIDSSIDILFTYGTESKIISDYVRKQRREIVCEHYRTKKELIRALKPYIEPETVLLFKGSRGMKLEDIIDRITN